MRPCTDAKFGDYQANAVMSLAKAHKLNPRQLATEVTAKLDLADLCERVEIAGAGFLNFHLKRSAFEAVLQEAASRGNLFDQATDPRTVVVDSARRTSPRRCMWGISVLRSWAIRSLGPCGCFGPWGRYGQPHW